MGAAAADVSLQGLHDLRLAGIGIFLKERDAADNHSRRAVGTLKRASIKKCLLHGMKQAALFEAFNGDDGFPGGVVDGELARTPRRAIQKYGAGTALPFAATVFRSGEAELLA